MIIYTHNYCQLIKTKTYGTINNLLKSGYIINHGDVEEEIVYIH